MIRMRGWNKFSARKTEYNGVMYDSGREAQYAADLDLLLKAGEIRKVERQLKFDFVVFDRKICQYRPDFRITHADGRIEYVDVKGHETRDFKIKWKFFLAWLSKYEPDAIARIVK